MGRANSQQSGCYNVVVDGDGASDWILGATSLLDGGVSDGVLAASLHGRVRGFIAGAGDDSERILSACIQ